SPFLLRPDSQEPCNGSWRPYRRYAAFWRRFGWRKCCLTPRDATVELLESRRAQFSVLVSEPDRGSYDALNKGIARASGDVVGFLHADDVCASPDVLVQVAEAFADPSVAAVHGDLQYVRKDDTARVVRHWKSSP